MSRLELIAGPNGAGKSTFVARIVSPSWPGVVFVNADLIAAERWPGDPVSHAHEAAAVAARTRSRLIELGRPFAAETVFSHPSKVGLVEEAKRAGYFVALHALMVPEPLAVRRVLRRAAEGGHAVPVEKVRQRFGRLWPLLARAVPLCDEATFWDNADPEGPVPVARFALGVLLDGPRWPAWTPAELSDRWPATEERAGDPAEDAPRGG